MAQELAELVLVGRKRAACWAACEGSKTCLGQRWVVLDGAGIPVAVIETVELTRRRFDEVEGTLAFWRREHQNYFGRRWALSPDMLLYCERFRLIAGIDHGPSPDLTPSGAAPGGGR